MKKKSLMPLALVGILFVTIGLQAKVPKVFKGYHITNFDQSMISNKKDMRKYSKILSNSSCVRFLEKLKKHYADFADNVEKNYSKKERIPKIIHQIWLGSPFPEGLRSLQKTWQEKHPEWKYWLWTDEDVADLKLINRKYFDQAKNYAEKADILRLELILKYGGVYIDVDFECVKPLDIFHHTCDFYTGLHAIPLMKVDKVRINNAIIGAHKNHPLIKYAVDQIKNYRHESQLMHRSGPDFFTKMIDEVIDDLDGINVVFPPNYFYPRKQGRAKDFRIKPGDIINLQPETCGIHLYASTWVGSSYLEQVRVLLKEAETA
jgi:mannosyltransferase OCH1-like enzyme